MSASKNMLMKQFRGLSVLNSKRTLTNIFLVANALVWYATILFALQDAVGAVGESSFFGWTGQAFIWTVHFSGLIVAALVGASVTRKIDQKRLLIAWIALSVVSSLGLSFLYSGNFVVLSFLGLILGVSLGFGMPACMSYYSDSEPVENRGRIGGITMLISGVGIFAFAVAPLTDPFTFGIALAAWRLLGLIVFYVAKSSMVFEQKRVEASFGSIISKQSFLSYYTPWIMFSFVNFLVPLQPNLVGETANNVLLIQTVFLAVFAVLGGFFLDSIGRKRTAIVGFIMLGLSSAALGFSSSVASLYFSAVFEGTAWGLLLVLFLLTLWGDLSYGVSTSKYYALGVTPFFISKVIELIFGNYITGLVPSTALFSFTAFFLFLAVLPLFYAEETLPERITQKRQLESYVAKALEKVNQKTKKDEKKETTNDENNEKTEETNQDLSEDEEARKLAEKYY
jgi:MFS family permease